jgi:tRNA (cmo5U34)-methyltransferase
MSVASHLNVTPAGYDRRIRQLIPHYDELIVEAAGALSYALRPIRQILDLGVGTGALAQACLAHAPRARLWGLDADPAMLSTARTRLSRQRSRVMLVEGSFLTTPLPACDAIVASYAFHHVRSTRTKLTLYRRCFAALRPGGVLVSGDCAPASTPHAAASDISGWITHLAPSSGGRAKARRIFESWADEDTYLPLATEERLLARAGFDVEVPWRRSPFAVIVGVKRRSQAELH